MCKINSVSFGVLQLNNNAAFSSVSARVRSENELSHVGDFVGDVRAREWLGIFMMWVNLHIFR